MSKCKNCKDEATDKCLSCNEPVCEDCGIKCEWCGEIECDQCVDRSEKDENGEPTQWIIGLGKGGNMCKGCSLNCLWCYKQLKKENEEMKKSRKEQDQNLKMKCWIE